MRWDLLPTEAEVRHFLSCYEAAATGTDSASEEEVASLTAEVDLFYPASHLFWGLWALVRSADENVEGEFDFYGYAEERLRCVFSRAAADAASVPA